ncbi:MAG TPA: hypothetical protein VIY68_05390 [Steroidobacteraceae bacterium]
MRAFRLTRLAWLLSATVLFASAAQAREIRQFDKMTSQDRSDYVASLVIRAQKVLIAEGRRDLADQVDKLFSEIPGGDEIDLGMTEFMTNLARARVADAERAAQDPSAHRLEVGDAMLVTLKKNNIPLSQDFIKAFRAVNNGFRPKFPPK